MYPRAWAPDNYRSERRHRLELADKIADGHQKYSLPCVQHVLTMPALRRQALATQPEHRVSNRNSPRTEARHHPSRSEIHDTGPERKVAAVTGGTRGIGRAIAEALLEAGAAVAFCGRSAEALRRAEQELASKGRAAACPADVARQEDVSAFFQFVDREFGGLDILVNNAGVGVFASVGEMSVEQWRRTIDTNLSGTFYCSREAIPRLRIRGGGSIINISSLAGKNPFAGGAAYNASKFGVNGFSEAMMLDHRYDGIRVSYIMPGSVNTDFGMSAKSDWKLAPRDVAEVVLMLLRMPARTLVSRVEMRLTKPAK